MVDILRNDTHVRTADDVRIAVREVSAPSAQPRTPMILMHGTRIPGNSEYDLPVENGSLSADLAARGHHCFIPDARGFGGSDRPDEMAQPRTSGRPIVRTIEITRDITAVAEHALAKTGADKVGLFGWGVGAMACMMYAALWPERVSHLVLYCPVYGGAGGHPKYGVGSKWDDPDRPGHFNQAEYGNYSYNAIDMLGADWARQIPIEDKDAWRDPNMLKAFQQALIDGDPTTNERTPPTFRSPNGMLEDLNMMGCGNIIMHASQVYARVMIVRPEYDSLSHMPDVEALAADLRHAEEVRLYAPPNTTQYIILDRPERGRNALLAEMDDFLD